MCFVFFPLCVSYSIAADEGATADGQSSFCIGCCRSGCGKWPRGAATGQNTAQIHNHTWQQQPTSKEETQEHLCFLPHFSCVFHLFHFGSDMNLKIEGNELIHQSCQQADAWKWQTWPFSHYSSYFWMLPLIVRKNKTGFFRHNIGCVPQLSDAKMNFRTTLQKQFIIMFVSVCCWTSSSDDVDSCCL